MASASAPPCTLFQSGDASRASMGLGPSGVAGVLRVVLQRKCLQSLVFSASQHLQHPQRPLASHVHAFECGAASAGAYARGFGPVASVASVASLKCIYISIGWLQRALQRLVAGSAQGVAGLACLLGSAAPRAIKYPRIFKGLGLAGRDRRGSAGMGVLAVSAAGLAAARAQLGQGARLGLDQGETGHFGARSPVEASPVASQCERYQHVRADQRLTDLAKAGVASRQNRPPRPPADPYPRSSPHPSSLARLAAPAPAFRGPSGRKGENADRWVGGFRGFGVPEGSAAKTGGPLQAGSGEIRHG